MKTALQIFSWIAIVIGALAIIGGFTSVDAYGNSIVNGSALLGGALFLTQGILALVYIDSNK
jgi:hypothetical protein